MKDAPASDAASGGEKDALDEAVSPLPSEGGAPASACLGTVASVGTPATLLPAIPALALPSGFTIAGVARVNEARQLVALPNGDLLVGSEGLGVYLVPNAEAVGTPDAVVPFATLGADEKSAQGIAFSASSCTVYVSGTQGIYALPYADGQMSAVVGGPIAQVRTGAITTNKPSGDTDVHTTTSVAASGTALYAGVGSSCNAGVETDPTRASIQSIATDGSQKTTTRATRIRNPIALAFNPSTGTLWAGGAGQDSLPEGHPFEFFDAVTSHPGVADYGWPDCEENHVNYSNQADAGCAATVAPLLEFPPYSTLIGAVFYPLSPAGPYAFPAAYRGGLFLTAHGSWHTLASGAYVSAPLVAYVAMNGDVPATPVDWNDPTTQWSPFVGGFQLADGMTRIGRPTGIAVGAQGSLFVADDQNGTVYRIRPR